jgi:hypothetical protein
VAPAKKNIRRVPVEYGNGVMHETKEKSSLYKEKAAFLCNKQRKSISFVKKILTSKQCYNIILYCIKMTFFPSNSVL